MNVNCSPKIKEYLFTTVSNIFLYHRCYGIPVTPYDKICNCFSDSIKNVSHKVYYHLPWMSNLILLNVNDPLTKHQLSLSFHKNLTLNWPSSFFSFFFSFFANIRQKMLKYLYTKTIEVILSKINFQSKSFSTNFDSIFACKSFGKVYQQILFQVK